jgi:hypothetical protein
VGAEYCRQRALVILAFCLSSRVELCNLVEAKLHKEAQPLNF